MRMFCTGLVLYLVSRLFVATLTDAIGQFVGTIAAVLVR